MRRVQTVNMNYASVKQKLLAAFKVLRSKHKILCRANFWCCQTCAGYDITVKATEVLDKGKVVNGCAFWTNQDEENFKDRGAVYLAFGQMNSEKYGPVGLTDEECGRVICDVLKANWLDYEWDGTGGNRILVKAVGT